MKNCLLVVALLSLALAGGCAKGGNGEPPPSLTVGDGNIAAIYPNQSVTFTATVGTPPEPVAATWSLSGTACTGTPNPCGTINSSTGVYQAPATPPSPSQITVMATATSNSSETGSLPVNLVQISVVVTPATITVGENLVQQFTAVAVPDDAPQTFVWDQPTCTTGANCGTISYDANNSGTAVYTAGSVDQSVVVPATWGSTVSGQAKVTVAASRLAAGAYAFRFSGYDNSGNAVAAAGSLTAGANGVITAGVEDVLNASGPQQYPITSGSYKPSAIDSNNISNNLGTLTLTLCISNCTTTPVTVSNTYTAVLTASGIIRMIESDGAGTGSGILQKSAADTVFNSGAQTFAFGFTGVDSSGNRVGYVGLLPMDGSGNIGKATPGLLDINDNGTASSSTNVTGTYAQNTNGVWQIVLNTGTTTLYFDFYVSGGTAQIKTGPNPLTLYAISTPNPANPTQPVYPALSGSMVFQVPMTYNNAAFDGSSVSNLTGVTPTVPNSSNVSLTVGTTDGTSGGTGGTGGFTGNFDWNNNGTIVSVPPPTVPSAPPCSSPTVCAFSYTYVASSSNTGRYIFQMLGNPNASPAVSPLPIILYASGANRGFLLDQSSPAVMTGTMDPQSTTASYAASELPGTYAAATIGNSDSSLTPVVENLLLTSLGLNEANPPVYVYNVAGIENPGNQTLTGAYTFVNVGTGTGTGTITLTSGSPATSVIYAIDASAVSGTKNDVITDFMMMGTCTPQPKATTCSSGPPSSIIFAQQ